MGKGILFLRKFHRPSRHTTAHGAVQKNDRTHRRTTVCQGFGLRPRILPRARKPKKAHRHIGTRLKHEETDIGSHIGRHRQHRQWGGVRSTIEVPMLPMPAYEGAYVTLLTEMGSAYVPMCFSWVSLLGRILGLKPNPWEKHHLNRARCGGELHEARHSAKANPKSTLPAPNSIEIGVEKVDFGTERDKKAPQKKFTSVSPCFKGLKSKNFGRKAANKKLTSVSPLQRG